MPRNPGKLTIQQIRRNKTHCIRGHKFTPENTGWINQKGRINPVRRCRNCATMREQLRRAGFRKGD